MNTIALAHPLPTNIADYLLQLRQMLSGADPAAIQDALYDAEEYLRAELAEQKSKNEAEVIAGVASSDGAPEEVAEIHRETDVTVTRALCPPAPAKRARGSVLFSLWPPTRAGTAHCSTCCCRCLPACSISAGS
ncbi:hypothetical protein XBLMG947_2596 [Xanthomonas bromi]|uniref:Uncharacterized protein n=1 Tax=Xanthomonas bromi TaxID=56449 RepID=A0A1C3NN27_9XANT|nr:hypothetical protein XBLMG947_2596 [Xanthomonas bromi]